jgi:predicted SnoaL-like aldol condensation-catalyzing enzyme
MPLATAIDGAPMTRLASFLLLVSLAAGTAAAADVALPSPSAVDQNKAIAIAYWNTLNSKGWDAASIYLDASYREHSGSSPSGNEELRAYYNTLKAAKPRHYSVIVRALAQDDLVFLHVHDFAAPGDFGEALMCFFRLKDGKIVEQWTAKQAVPGIRNFNGMF